MRNPARRAASVLALCLLVTLAATVPVALGTAADSDSGDEDSLASEIVTAATDEGSVVRTALAFAGGVADRVLAFGTPDTDASAACEALRTTITDHSGTLQDYANDRVDASTSADVLELECVVGDTTATIYVTADVNGSGYANATAVNATSRTVDESCTLTDDAAANASDELDRLVDQYVGANETIPRSEYARLAGRYRGDVDCSFALED